jgi:hypothetical protein
VQAENVNALQFTSAYFKFTAAAGTGWPPRASFFPQPPLVILFSPPLIPLERRKSTE